MLADFKSYLSVQASENYLTIVQDDRNDRIRFKLALAREVSGYFQVTK